ncbi:MAG: type II toxin-antitoxin system VapC family toxin [Chloroflexi bacterium]|nr:type II toxin-antitoxin system VapC family toxin [Chloroflexota bacterium]MYF79838.1 type II toxin-antitoxin system VapC family toxin [Chloroflexota bacterium]MYK60495.1 type II toxin-antitoxin system VapC family toxin [Chloroflexota bacterium]
MRYLVDTDWVIHYLNGDDNICERLDRVRDDGVAVSIVTLAEVYEGISQSPDQTAEELAFLRLLGGFEVLGLRDDICKLFGFERARLRSAGTLIGDFDLLIGCTAVIHDLTVLTNNRRHFERIADIELETA